MGKLSLRTQSEFATKLLKGSVIFVMKNLSKQVVILDKISSPYIHQAIIILKDYSPEHHDKIMAEAEQIVSSYFDRKPDNIYIGRKSKNYGLKCAVIGFCICLIFSLCFAFIN